MISAPRTGCAFIFVRSSLVSLSCLSRISSRTPILPMSWSRPPHSRASMSLEVHFITRPMSLEICMTRWEWFAVNGSRLSTALARLWMVWVNISRISREAWLAIRVMYIGTANSTVVHHPSVEYVLAMSHASGARAAKLPLETGKSASKELPRLRPVLRLARVDAKIRLSENITAAPANVATKSLPVSGDPIDRDRATHAPAIAGSAMPAWLARVPYHGIRPRSSRSSVEPRRATQATAAGPPKFIATITGAMDTATMDPPGSTIGSAEAMRVISGPKRHAQDQIECAGPSEPDFRTHRNSKTRDHYRNCGEGHESSDIQLQGPRHQALAQVITSRTLNPPSSAG